jgi:hypothetical protein
MPKKRSAKKPAKVKAQPKKKKESGKRDENKVEDFGRAISAWIHSGAKPQQ